MTRKSARYIGEQCRKLSMELEQNAKWLTKKINRKLYQEHSIKIYDSYYDVDGVYLIFKQYNTLVRPYHPPETIVVDVGTVWSAVGDAAMVDMHSLKVSVNCNWRDNDCFMIYIPFRLYYPNRLGEFVRTNGVDVSENKYGLNITPTLRITDPNVMKELLEKVKKAKERYP